MSFRVVVIGGGISGLAAAHRLTELREQSGLDAEVLLLEGENRLGGAIHSERIDDFLVEAGPDSFLTEKPWALNLCGRLGLGQRLISPDPARQGVEIVHDGALHLLPDGFVLLAPTRLWPLLATPLFSWRGKMRMILEPFMPHRPRADESLASFVRRRLGREALEHAAQPLIGGIYAADAERLSLAATMPRFLEMERAGRSVIFGLRRERRRRLSGRKEGSGARWGLFVSLAGGMREIVDAIASRLDKESVRLGAEASTLAPNSGEKRWLVIGRDGRKTEADAVILALPAHASARLLAPTNPELGRELAAIPYASTAVATFAYRKKDVEGGLKSFGLLAPRREGRKIFACSFSNVKYPGRAPADGVLLRLFVGGALGPELCVKDDAEIVRIARAEIKTLLGVAAEPLFSRLDRHPDSMPQYLVGHLDRVERIFALAASHAGLALAGNGYRGVGIPDCILSGEQAAEKVWDFLRPPRALQKD